MKVKKKVKEQGLAGSLRGTPGGKNVFSQFCFNCQEPAAVPWGSLSAAIRWTGTKILGRADAVAGVAARRNEPHWRALCLATLLCILALAGCGGKKATKVKPPRVGSVESGIASWYGHPYHGRAAANGEIYDMEKLTAAHRTLPFGAWVRVRNVQNDRTVDVRITDRGPFIDGRIIDLSLAAARTIEMVGPGVVPVKVQILALPENLPPEELLGVQVGAFEDRANAEHLRQDLEQRFGSARLLRREARTPVWRVVVGRERTQDGAEALRQRLADEFASAFVVRLDEIRRP